MLLQTWLTLLVLVVAALTSLVFLYLSIRRSSGLFFVFWLGLVGISASRFLYFYIDRLGPVEFYRDFISLGGLSFILVGLFILIRDSKPEVARFPASFTLLPLAILPFYPLLNDKAVLRELLMLIIQGGGIVVALLILSMRQIKDSRHAYLIFGILFFAASYVLKWFIFNAGEHQWTYEISLSLGMIICTYGFLKQSILTNKEV